MFLFVFDWNSYPSRKNPQACVEAFLGAFGSDRTVDVCLVLKTMGARENDPRWATFRHLIAQDPRIVVINETMERTEVLRLIADCDCFVSLHRAEGFGRGIAEAMLLGKPVIATAFSGNLDFCTPTTAFLVPAGEAVVGADDYPFAKDQVWAEPSFFAAVDAFRLAFGSRDLGQRIAQAGRRIVQQLYSPETVGKRYASRLRQIAVGGRDVGV